MLMLLGKVDPHLYNVPLGGLGQGIVLWKTTETLERKGVEEPHETCYPGSTPLAMYILALLLHQARNVGRGHDSTEGSAPHPTCLDLPLELGNPHPRGSRSSLLSPGKHTDPPYAIEVSKHPRRSEDGFSLSLTSYFQCLG